MKTTPQEDRKDLQDAFGKIEPTHKTMCRDLIIWSGGKWHEVNYNNRTCTCGKKFRDFDDTYQHLGCTSNPTLNDAKSIIELMMKRNDGGDFLDHICLWNYYNVTGGKSHNLNIKYILNPAALLKEAWEFIKERK